MSMNSQKSPDGNGYLTECEPPGVSCVFDESVHLCMKVSFHALFKKFYKRVYRVLFQGSPKEGSLYYGMDQKNHIPESVICKDREETKFLY